MSDYEAMARELFALVKQPHMADAGFAHIVAALQSAHAAGKAEDDRAGYERGVGDAAVAVRGYQSPEINNCVTYADDAVLALLPAQPKEPA